MPFLRSGYILLEKHRSEWLACVCFCEESAEAGAVTFSRDLENATDVVQSRVSLTYFSPTTINRPDGAIFSAYFKSIYLVSQFDYGDKH
jgi:hypothetical protein